MDHQPPPLPSSHRTARRQHKAPLVFYVFCTKRISDKKDGRTSISFLEGTHNLHYIVRCFKVQPKKYMHTEKMYQVDKFFSKKTEEEAMV